MRGFANATQDFLLEPEGFSVLMERMVGFGCALMRAAVRHGFHGIRFADDWGTHLGLMISPALWRELFKPRYARQFALAHALGLHPWHHCGGEFLAIMEDFSEIGVEVLNITSLAAALTRRGVRLTSPGIRSKLAASKGFPVQKQILRIRRDKAGLVVVDIQERFRPVIFEMPRVVQNALRLINGALILRVPVFATEQYRKGLGATVPEIASAIPDFAPMEKNTFCCCGTPGFVEALRTKGVQDVILCGIEAHVCVCQTSLGLLEAGFRPFVVADAISSRTTENHRLAVERMRDAGAVIVSTEMILFELLERAGTDEFKRMLTLVK